MTHTNFKVYSWAGISMKGLLTQDKGLSRNDTFLCRLKTAPYIGPLPPYHVLSAFRLTITTQETVLGGRAVAQRI